MHIQFGHNAKKLAEKGFFAVWLSLLFVMVMMPQKAVWLSTVCFFRFDFLLTMMPQQMQESVSPMYGAVKYAPSVWSS